MRALKMTYIDIKNLSDVFDYPDYRFHFVEYCCYIASRISIANKRFPVFLVKHLWIAQLRTDNLRRSNKLFVSCVAYTQGEIHHYTFMSCFTRIYFNDSIL